MRIHRGCNYSMTANFGELLGEQMTWLELSVKSETMDAQGVEGREQENKLAVLAGRRGQGVSK